MSGVNCVQKVNAFNDYISNVANRDRVMSVVQFVSMALSAPAAAAGCPKLSADCKTVLDLSAQYRAITRFSQWFVVIPSLTPNGIRETIRNSPTPLIGILKTISTACFTVFLIGEEVVLASKYKIVSASLGKKLNRIRFVFLFWSNVIRLVMNFLTLKASTFSVEKDGTNEVRVKDQRRKVLSVADSVLQTMFVYTLLKGSVPAGPKYLTLALKSGDFVDIITSFAPPLYIVPSTPQGLLGLVASVPGFMMSVL